VAYDYETLRRIYDRTDGDCHICCGKLSFRNYANHGSRGAWEVEHSKPRSRGGTGHLNNLYAAHISCNRSKAAQSTRKVRSQYGRKRAPYCREKKASIRRSNAITGGVIGGLIGSIGGPVGSAIGAAIGAKISHDIDPNG
jgi:5-methylcytosine-specific restriction endonuclease McrA